MDAPHRSTTIAYLALSLIGSGWLGQTISARGRMDLLRPILDGDEARDVAADVRAQLKQNSAIAACPGLNHAAAYGDFQTIRDVRVVYVTNTFEPYAPGLFGMCEATTTTREELADFDHEDHHLAFTDDEEED